MATYAFLVLILTLFSVDEILLPWYVNESITSIGLPLKVNISPC